MTQEQFTFDSRRDSHSAVKSEKSDRKAAILELLRARGPLTADELADALTVAPYCLRPRICELRDDGLIFAVGRKAGINGTRITQWSTERTA